MKTLLIAATAMAMSGSALAYQTYDQKPEMSALEVTDRYERGYSES